jgi:hypothetical protein
MCTIGEGPESGTVLHTCRELVLASLGVGVPFANCCTLKIFDRALKQAKAALDSEHEMASSGNASDLLSVGSRKCKGFARHWPRCLCTAESGLYMLCSDDPTSGRNQITRTHA